MRRLGCFLALALLSLATAFGQSAPPAITVQPASTTANAGQSVTLSLTATGSPTPTIQWFKDGQAVTGATNTSLTFSSVFGADAGTYTAVVSSVVNGTSYNITSAPAVLSVITTPPTIITQPVSQGVLEGGNVTFSVTAAGSGPLLYRWSRNGVEVDGATNSSLTIGGVKSSDAGGYRVVVSSRASQIKAVSSGRDHTMYLATDGTLWGMGLNDKGQLGDGSMINRSAPVQVASDVASVSAGEYHTMFLKTNGTLWGMGSNGSGQLGDGTTTDRSTPVQVASGVSSVSLGAYHTMFLKTDGTLWGMGNNGNGRLGDGTTTSRSTPVQVASGVTSVSVGNFIGLTMFLKTDETLWGMGNNFFGGLGDGTTTERSTPVQVASGVSSVSVGYRHTMFLKTDGTLWGMGSNSAGQLGDGTTTDRSTPVQVASGVASVSVGGAFTMFLKTDRTLWGMGYNGDGQLGDATKFNRSTPMQVASGVSTVSAGSDRTMFLTTNGNLCGMGSNSDGQLGDPTTTSRTYAVQVASGVASVSMGNTHTMFLKTDDSLWGMGRNVNGQLGDGTTTNRRTPVRILGSQLSDIASLTVYTLSIATQPSSQTSTVGFPLTLTVIASGEPAPSYQWQKNGANLAGATNPTYTVPTAVAGDAGSYTVIVRNSGGSITSSEATVTVEAAAPAGITTQPAHVTGKVGEPATLTLTATGSPMPTVQWLKNGTAIAGATSYSLAFAGVQKADAASYTATIQNVYLGSTYSLTTSAAILTVIAPPVFTTHPQGRTILAGGTVTLSSAVQGLAATTFQWNKNGAPVSGATNASLVISAAATTDAGTYTVVATNSEGSTTSNAAELVVNAVVPPAITGAPASVTLPNGERTQLKVTATGTGTLTYQWFQGQSGSTTNPVNGATGATFTTPALTATTSYWVRVTDSNGGVTNGPTVTVTVSATSPLAVSQAVMGHGYMAGGAVTVTNTITYTGTAPSRIDWATLLPTGWRYVGSGGSEGAARPPYESGDLLEWSWTTVPASPIKFTYTVSVPAGTTGDQVIASLVTSQAAGTNYQTMAKPDPLVIRSASLHSADSNRDGKISLIELTRVIELYNYRSNTTRTGQYKPQSGTEDGFSPGP